MAVRVQRGKTPTTVAVGMAVTGHPPHRPVLAELPHTVPTLDVSPNGNWRQYEGAEQNRWHACNAHTKSQRGPAAPHRVGWASEYLAFSLAAGLPSTTSAAGVSTDLVRQLRRYYARARLLASVHARITLLASRADPLHRCHGYWRGLSVLARVVSRRAHGSWTTPGLTDTRVIVPVSVAFPWQALGRRPEFAFRSSIPRPSMPLSTLHPAPHGTRRKTRGQDGSLLLSRGALSSPTTRRFIPTIALACARGSVTPPDCGLLQSRDRERCMRGLFRQSATSGS
jgi:hypothetical protein